MKVNEGAQDAPETEVDGQEPDSSKPDPIQNLKAEFSRKLENQNAALAEQNRKLEEILQSVTASTRSQPEPTKSLKDLVLDDPDAFASEVVSRATSIANKQVEKQFSHQQSMQSTVMELSTKYPEFADQNSEATKIAIQKAASLPQHLRGTPEGAKLAMMDAVAELGLVTASKRNTRPTSDDFSLSGSSAPSSRQRPSDPKKDVPQETLEFAALLGIDINDKKRIEGLKQASQRKNWNKYG